MITKSNVELVKLSLKMFNMQTYQNKEIVIVTDPGQSRQLYEELNLVGNNEIVLVNTDNFNYKPTLGELRNLAISSARGEYVCQWDDDDLYHPDRLSVQMRLLIENHASACIMNQWIIWWPLKKRFAISNKRYWEGSLLAKKSIIPAYPSIKRGEDTPVVSEVMRNNKTIIIKNPNLYMYVVHGNNTFDEDHFELMYKFSATRFENESYDAAYRKLRNIFLLDDYPIFSN